MFKPGKTVVVTFEARGGRWATTTTGASLYESVSNAMRFFADKFWKGPKPGPSTMFEVRVISEDRLYHVLASRVLEWRVEGARGHLKS